MTIALSKKITSNKVKSVIKLDKNVFHIVHITSIFLIEKIYDFMVNTNGNLDTYDDLKMLAEQEMDIRRGE